jgi:hypothetical protein
LVIGLEYYDPKIVQESYEELKAFLHIVNKTLGYYPTIIGGWAVYSYTNDIKSQDIDAVMYDPESYYKFIYEDFFRKRQYREFNVGGDDQHLGKQTIDSNGRPATIRFDVMFANNPQVIQKLGIVKNWKLILDNQKSVPFNGGNMYVPIREALITFKIIAALEREQDMKYVDDELVPLFLSKIKKDHLDVASLIKLNPLEKEKLSKLFEETGVKSHASIFIENYKRNDYSDIFERLDINFDLVKKALSI